MENARFLESVFVKIRKNLKEKTVTSLYVRGVIHQVESVFHLGNVYVILRRAMEEIIVHKKLK